MSGANKSHDKNGGKKQLNPNQIFRRQKVRNARTIRTEAIHASNKSKNDLDKPLSENGTMIHVDRFIGSREYELKQLQYAMLKSKSSSSTRVFQALPRKLRRRTASHNVKRIPKRMRNRALKEMLKNDQQSNTGNKTASATNKKAHGLSSSRLYRAKMSVKLLRLASKSMSMKLALPSHVTASKYNVRQRINYLKKLIKDSKVAKQTTSSHVNSGELNNKCGSYDNTGLNTLAPLPRGRIKYCKRQRQFTWLPTHIWNAKRSHLIKRWGFNIPWSPSQKCFKLAHRLGSGVAASDGALCMDTSFMGTMIINNISENNPFLKTVINKLTKGRAILNKYYNSKHLYEGLIYDVQEEEEPKVLGPCNLLWVNPDEIILRLHPAIYSTIFNYLTKVHSKELSIQDCRYSLASITIRGAKALTALSSILRSTNNSKTFNSFKKVSNVSDSSVLPSKMNFAMEVIDPRHLSAPKKIDNKYPVDVEDIISMSEDQSLNDEYNKILRKLTTVEGREKSYENQQTLKQLSKRRQELLEAKNINDPNTQKRMIQFKDSSDPSIPLLLLKRPKENDWLLIMPWFWHLPIWYQLNRVSRVYNMGLRQVQQLSYENKQLYFPDDYPFTDVGALENSTYKSKALRVKWEKKTPGKRLNFEKVSNIHSTQLPGVSGEIGDYFSCDWKFLQLVQNGIEYLKQTNAGQLPMINEGRTTQFDAKHRSRLINNINDLLELYKDITDDSDGPSIESQLPTTPICLVNSKAISKLETKQFENTAAITKIALPVTAVSCNLIRRGHPKDNARIYSIPKKDIPYWESIGQGVYKANGTLDNDRDIPLPEITNLIGFITSGTFNLADGHGRGNGFIASKHLQGEQSFDKRHVLVRNVGTNIYRLARIEYISV